MLLTDKSKKQSPIWTVFLLAPLMSVCSLVTSMVLEDWSHLSGAHGLQDTHQSFWTVAVCILVGLTATAMTSSEYMLVKLTS